jgi:anaerobic ribonucleoside-triphosphate reductase activating protein
MNYGSISAGPGVRTELFFQGCEAHCEGCFSPDTWYRDGGVGFSIAQVLHFLYPDEEPTERITICGGEPFAQIEALRTLLCAIRSMADDLGYPQPTILLYTGYSLMQVAHHLSIMQRIDFLVDGSFKSDRCVMSRPTDFIGSANQRFYVMRDGTSIAMFTAEVANDVNADPTCSAFMDRIPHILRDSKTVPT